MNARTSMTMEMHTCKWISKGRENNLGRGRGKGGRGDKEKGRRREDTNTGASTGN